MFKQSAPVIKLREGASEEEYLRLLGLLNSSTAGFWLKMVSHSKGTEGHQCVALRPSCGSSSMNSLAQNFRSFPLPAECPTALATALDVFAQQLAATSPISRR